MREIRVVPYDDSWPDQYEQESIRIKGVLGKEIVNI